MLPNVFIQEVIELKLRVKFMLIGCYLSCALSLITTSITPRGINKINLSILGLISAAIGVSFAQLEDRLNLKLLDLNIQARVSAKEIYSGLLKDNTFEITIPTAPITEQDIITNPVEYWLSQEKHLAIIAGTGSGKSFTIKTFINALQHEFSFAAYDIDFCRDDYLDCVDVKFEYSDIEQALIQDMEELEQRIAERRQLGKKYVPDKKLIVAEEAPALSDGCESFGAWMRKMSKRGRKCGLFIVAVAQNDSARNFAIDGDYKILQSNFVLLYLGGKAKERAKQLKNNALLEWLNGATKGRGLINDLPVEIKANNLFSTTNTLPEREQLVNSSTSESAAGSGIEANKVDFETVENSDKMLQMARILKADGYSKTQIIKLIWGIDGGSKFTELSKLIDN